MSQMKQEYILKAKYEGKGELGQFQADIKALGKIESIKKLGKSVRDLSDKFNTAKKKLQLQAKEMRSADTVTRQMTKSYQASQREVTRLAAALDRKKKAFRESTAAAKSAGVNTRNLTAEERRLATASKETGKVWAARRALGVRSHKDISVEVRNLQRAYTDLKKSGKATTLELFQAKQKLRQKTSDLVRANHNWASSYDKVRVGAVALVGVGYAAIKVFKEFTSFESGMAEVNTLLDISTNKFASFKKETKDIIGSLPQQSSDLTKSLYDIISAGVALEDSGIALEKSGKAATAGITDTKTAVSIGIGAMNAYNKEIGDLEWIYDVLFQTVKSGVTTFPELAQSMGDVLPVARAAEIQLPEVSAAIAALTKAGIKTPQAATAIKGAIRAMAAPAPEAKKKFEALGITWNGLLPTLEQIAEKSLSIDQMRELIPDSEASTGVLSLTQNLDEFKAILLSMDDAGGSMERAYNKMKDTPDAEIKEMMKSVHNLAVGLGELASYIILPLADGFGWLADRINNSNVVIKTMLSLLGGGVTVFALWKLGLGQIAVGLAEAAIKTNALIAATTGYTGAVAAAKAGVAKLTAVMLANPILAGMTIAVLAGAAAWAIFGKDSLAASKKHGDAAKQLGKGRKEIDGQIKALDKLRSTFNKASPGSKEYLKAERDLANLLPGANLALDEHGRLIARVGDAAADNSIKLDAYIAKLREESSVNLALQTEQQVQAYIKAGAALDNYKENMRDWYGIGGDGGFAAPLWRAVNKLTGTYDKNIAKGESVRQNLQEQEKSYKDLMRAMAGTGMTADQLSAALDKAHVSAELKDRVINDYQKLGGAIDTVTAAAKKSASEQKDSFGNATAEIKQQYLALAREIKGILDEIAGRQRSLTAELREMARSGMSDYSAWKDLKAEADEYYTAAENAAKAGDFDEAVKLADEAKSKYKELNREVKDGEKVLVSQAEAQKAAMNGVKKAGELAIDVLGKQKEAVQENADKLEKMAGDFAKNWKTAWDKFLQDGKHAIDALEKDIDKLTKPRTAKINVVKSESHRFGGMIGLKMMLGGLVRAQKLAGGGAVRNGLSGLMLPGYGGGDRRWIIGEDGEVMLKKESVRAAGSRAALAFNSGQWSVVIRELMSRFSFKGLAVKRRFGGFVNAVASPRATAMPRQLVDTVSAATSTLRHEHILRAPNGNTTTLYSDDLNAERLLNIFKNGLVSSS